MDKVTVAQMRKLDRLAINGIGIPSLVLMENAGRAVANEVLRYCKKSRRVFVCIVCGVGNNAGDGLVVARYLIERGIKVKVFLIGRANGLKGDALIQYRIIKKMHCSAAQISSVTAGLRRDLARAGVIVDALFGTGLSRSVGEPFKSVIEAANCASARIISVDIPSGLNGTTGRTYGACVKAAATVTFAYAKTGFFRNDGPACTGRLIVADIGIPTQLLKRVKK